MKYIYFVIIHAYVSLRSFFQQNPTRLKYKRNHPEAVLPTESLPNALNVNVNVNESRGSSHVLTTTCSQTGDLK